MICAIPQDSTAASFTDEVSLWHFALSSALISVEHSSGICVLSNTLALVSLKLVNHLGPCNHRAHGDLYRIQSSAVNIGWVILSVTVSPTTRCT